MAFHSLFIPKIVKALLESAEYIDTTEYKDDSDEIFYELTWDGVSVVGIKIPDYNKVFDIYQEDNPADKEFKYIGAHEKVKKAFGYLWDGFKYEMRHFGELTLNERKIVQDTLYSLFREDEERDTRYKKVKALMMADAKDLTNDYTTNKGEGKLNQVNDILNNLSHVLASLTFITKIESAIIEGRKILSNLAIQKHNQNRVDTTKAKKPKGPHKSTEDKSNLLRTAFKSAIRDIIRNHLKCTKDGYRAKIGSEKKKNIIDSALGKVKKDSRFVSMPDNTMRGKSYLPAGLLVSIFNEESGIVREELRQEAERGRLK